MTILIVIGAVFGVGLVFGFAWLLASQRQSKEIANLQSEIVAKIEQAKSLNDKLENQKKELEGMDVRFENIANRVLKARSDEFATTSAGVLGPLKEKINDFRTRVDQVAKEESDSLAVLKEQIGKLEGMNEKLSGEANNLALALKGESKTQGDWGEVQLETILEYAGLMKGVNYKTQDTHTAEGGNSQRLDLIINLPDDRHLIIDSKVSLTAYIAYAQATTEEARLRFSAEHLASVRGHIGDLSSKNYQSLYGINVPDYVLMFVSPEGALALATTLALREKADIFQEALKKNIVLVTGSTLLATMKTVAYMWKQENQKKNVLEIAKQGGLLYDRFVNFVESLRDVGGRMKSAQDSYEDAMRTLCDGTRKGDTLIGRAEKLRQLGAKVTKKLPKELVDQSGEEDELKEKEQ